MTRPMKIEDYEEIYRLWLKIKGFAIRAIDDSKEGIERFLRRNPDTSIVAIRDGKIVGSILCGHDGRRGCFYHVCVDSEYRMQGIGKEMVEAALAVLREEKISKIALIAFEDNDLGNTFWHEIGFTEREDLNYYDYTIHGQEFITIE